jgi:hypothetical protein
MNKTTIGLKIFTKNNKKSRLKFSQNPINKNSPIQPQNINIHSGFSQAPKKRAKPATKKVRKV